MPSAAQTAALSTPVRPAPSLAARPTDLKSGPSAAGRSGAGESAFALQVGAFRSEAAAQVRRDEVVARLKEGGNYSAGESLVRIIERDGVFRVFLGQADSALLARALKSRMRDLIPPDSFIVRPR